jgi:hypothetical protein
MSAKYILASGVEGTDGANPDASMRTLSLLQILLSSLGINGHTALTAD